MRGISYGGGIGGIISRKSAEYGQQYYIYDGLGNVTNILNPAGAIVQSYAYEAFGKIVAQSGSVVNPYQFQTKHHSPVTGLSHFGFRYYNPAVGRFVSADPLGFIDGPNVYAYCFNNPVNFVDPFGLCKDKPWWEKIRGSIGIELGVSGGALFGGGISIIPTLTYSSEHGFQFGIQIVPRLGVEFWGHGGGNIGVSFTTAGSFAELKGWGHAIGGSGRIGPLGVYGDYLISDKPVDSTGRHLHGLEFGWAPGIGTEGHLMRTYTHTIKIWESRR